MSSTKPSILIIHVWMGPLHDNFRFWLRSCEQNVDIDFLLVTDQEFQISSPNVTVLRTTLDDLRCRLERKLNKDVWLEQAYKLCDYKPFYVYMFPEYSERYDFWGYCDSDLIFGDIRHFFPVELLSQFDYFLGMGHFHIQRVDDPKYETVWKNARGLWNDVGWREVTDSFNNEYFDELPQGVSGSYYRLYPERFWSGYDTTDRCFESPVAYELSFIDYYNNYDYYAHYDGYQNWLSEYPFWKRMPGNDLRYKVYKKDGVNLYVVGVNDNNTIEERNILYVHFYKRHLHAQTDCLSKYIICPDKIISTRRITNSFLWINYYNRMEYVHRQLGRVKRLFLKLLKRE